MLCSGEGAHGADIFCLILAMRISCSAALFAEWECAGWRERISGSRRGAG